MKEKPIRPARERGSILIFSLIGTLVLFALVAPLLWSLSGNYRVTERNFLVLAALSLAEAGVERAIWELNKGDITTWTGDLLVRRLSLSGVQATGGTAVGDLEIAVLNPASDNPVVETTGRVPWVGGRSVTRSLRVVLQHGFKSHFDFGIFGDEGFDLHGDAYTDSYDGTVGPYDPLNPGTYGDVGTNADQRWDVVLLNNTLVNGNASTGYQSDPELVIRLSNNAQITGTKTALDTPKMMPALEPPLLTERGALAVPTNTYDTTITESGRYTAFSLAANSKVTISGQVTLFIDGDFRMFSNTIIDILPGSEVEFVLGNGTFDMDANSTINNLTCDPRSFAILGTSAFQTMTMNSNSDFYGVIYVPEATLNMSANADFYGSMVADYVSMSSNAGVHYDESLGTWTKYGVHTSGFVVKSWQEIY